MQCAQPPPELRSEGAQEAPAAAQAPAQLEAQEVPSIADVLEQLEHEWGHCVALYQHGSSVFLNKEPADIDLLAVIDEPSLRPVRCASPDAQFKLGRFEVSVYTRSCWLQKLALMDITMLTCVSLPAKFVLREEGLFREELESVPVRPQELFDFARAYAEFTWLKAKTLLRKPDVHKSCKNLSYVFRVLELAAQVLQHGRIVDFQAANHWWDRAAEAYSALEIGPQDWGAVEALFARDFQREVARVRRLVGQPAGGPIEDGPAFAAQPDIAEVCACCSGPLSASETAPLAESTVVLPRCGHKLHCQCALARWREAGSAAACPACQGPWCLDLDEHATSKLWARLRGTGEWHHVTRLRHGRHWDHLLEDVPMPTDHVEEPPSAAEVDALEELWAEIGAVRSRVHEASQARREAFEAAMALRHEMSFGGYPATLLTEEEAATLPKRVVTLDVREGMLLGTGLSGDEVFRVEVGGAATVGELRGPIASAVGLRVGSVTLSEGDRALRDSERLDDLRALMASLAPAADAMAQSVDDLVLRRAELAELRIKLDALYEMLREQRAERQAKQIEERRRRWEELERLRKAVCRRRKTEDGERRSSQLRLLGVVLRRRGLPAAPRKAAAEERRAREHHHAARRRAHLAAKELRGAAAPGDRRGRQRRVGAGRVRSGRYGGFAPEFLYGDLEWEVCGGEL